MISLSLLTIIYFWCLVTLSNLSYSNNAETSYLCMHCCISVSKENKHCDICNKCVFRFDHHCKILNNCIGKKNYKNFVYLLLALFVFHGLLGFYSAFLIHIYVKDSNELNQVYWASASISPKSLIYLNFILCIESLVVAFIDAVFIAFHGFLKIKGLTTYEYIMKKKKKASPQTLPRGLNNDNIGFMPDFNSMKSMRQ